jgi:Tat protein secretion system quality control protein TatD with DNase activity
MTCLTAVKLAQCGLDKASAGRSDGGGGGGNCSLDEQEEVFKQQLALAREMSRPVTVPAQTEHMCSLPRN